MVYPKDLVFNDPAHLPKNFNTFKIIGPAISYLNKIKKTPQSSNASSNPNKPTTVTTTSCTYLGITSQMRTILQNNKFSELQEIKAQAQRDVQPLYDRIASLGLEAWVLAESGALKYFIAWSQDAFVFCYCGGRGTYYPNQPKQYFVADLSFGIQSNNLNLISKQSWTFVTPYLMNWTDPSLILTATLSSFMNRGLSFEYTDFANRLTNYANSYLGNQFNFYTPDDNIGQTVESLVFAVIFIGLRDLIDTNKHRTRLQFYNWDQTSKWEIKSQSFDNVLYAGSNGTQPLNVQLNTIWDINNQMFWPDFVKIKIDVLVPYSVHVYQNSADQISDSQLAIEALNDGNQYGFSFAANLPKLGNHTQYIEGKPMDPRMFLKRAEDKLVTTLKLSTTTQNGIPVTTSMVTTPQGVMNQLFDFRIHLGLNFSVPSNL